MCKLHWKVSVLLAVAVFQLAACGGNDENKIFIAESEYELAERLGVDLDSKFCAIAEWDLNTIFDSDDDVLVWKPSGVKQPSDGRVCYFTADKGFTAGRWKGIWCGVNAYPGRKDNRFLKESSTAISQFHVDECLASLYTE